MLEYRLLRRADVGMLPDELTDSIAPHYPDGRVWAARRLPQAADGDDVHAHIAVDADAIVGLVLVIPKGGRTKIATVWVDRSVRRRHIAASLVARAVAPYADTTIDATAPSSTRAVFASLFGVHGIVETAGAADRYGPGRDEVVFSRPPVPAGVRARRWPGRGPSWSSPAPRQSRAERGPAAGVV